VQPILIREVGPREGFQSFEKIYPTEAKVRLIDELSGTGLRSLEVAAFVRADRVPQMADAEEIAKRIVRTEEVAYSGLYLNPKGFVRAHQTGLVHEGWIPIAASEAFLKRNNNLTFDELYATLPKWEEEFARAGVPLHGLMVSAAFGSNDDGPYPPSRVTSAIREVLSRLSTTPREICLADTMGWGTPSQLIELVESVRSLSPAEVSLHLHDTRGTGIANAWAGLQAGVKIFDASFGGVGGCPFVRGAAGNIATEELVFLAEANGYTTGIELESLLRAVSTLESVLAMTPPSRLYRAWKSTTMERPR
jgi:hydroxymethylglutaryl-CoA lyase